MQVLSDLFPTTKVLSLLCGSGAEFHLLVLVLLDIGGACYSLLGPEAGGSSEECDQGAAYEHRNRRTQMHRSNLQRNQSGYTYTSTECRCKHVPRTIGPRPQL